MAQPPAYAPAHAFIADSAVLANFPGQSLDVEFNALAAVTGAIETNLGLIQRNDGQLANGLVTFDSLSGSLQTNGLAAAAPWATNVAYLVGAAVVSSNNLYRCLIAHTSTVFATNLAAGDWILVSSLLYSGGANITFTGSVISVSLSPAFTTPSLGVATATSINGNVFTSGTYTLTGSPGKTFTFSNTLAIAGVDGSTLTFQGSDTYVGRATTDTLTNKTFDTAGVGNSFLINGSTITSASGSGNAVVLTAGPTINAPILTTPVLGVATATSLASAGFVTAAGAIISNAAGGVGYATGAGGTVTQITTRTTGVTLNTPTGQINMFGPTAWVVGTWLTFTVTNSQVGANDIISLVCSGANSYNAVVTNVAAGSFKISISSIVGTASEVAQINFAIIKGAVS